jgi:hypothetical protein
MVLYIFRIALNVKCFGILIIMCDFEVQQVGILHISILSLLQSIMATEGFLTGGKLTHRSIMEVSDKIPSELESATSDTNRETEDVITDISDTLLVPDNVLVSSAHLLIDLSSPVPQNILVFSEHLDPSSSPVQYSSDSKDDTPLAESFSSVGYY